MKISVAAAAASLMVLASACASSATNEAAGEKTAAAETKAAEVDAALQSAVAGAWRTPANVERDVYRKPVEALTFWGLKPGMTVLEISPGGGWWTEILAPYARMTDGRYIATAADLGNPELSQAAKDARAKFEARFADDSLYGKVSYVNFGPKSAGLGAPNSVDLVINGRNIHGWMGGGFLDRVMADSFAVLKSGGILAIEEHRNAPGTEQDPKAASGYVTEAYVIAAAEKAGFKLDGRSEIYANPKDDRDHPFGVWTLPPTKRTAPAGQPENPKFDRAPYDAIGESDRMALRFVKP
jgi:predicted methyltransferase